MDDFKGKKAFVTGGSMGIGRAAAEQLARAGASVVVAARGQAALDDTVAALQKLGGDGQVFGAVSMDVTDRPAVEAGAARALELLGGVDLLICNSGMARPTRFELTPLDDFDLTMGTNFMGHVNTVKAFLPAFLAQKSGHVNLVSSVIGFLPLYGYGAYCASKFAIAGFAEVLYMELKEHGVEVSLYFPPTTDTPGLARENEVKDPVAAKVEHDSMFSSTFTAEQVAAGLLDLVKSGRFSRTHGAMNQFIYHFNRHFPNVARWMNYDEVVKAKKKLAQA